jgi:4-carboxymuconolactone decarboxylase
VPKTNDALGGRIALSEPTRLTTSQKSLYKVISETAVPWADASGFVAKVEDGRLIGPFNIVLESPELGGAFLEFQNAEQNMTSLSERVRQIVILTVGSVWKAPYELYAHAAVARTTGLPENAIEELAKGEVPTGLPKEEQLAQQFTKQLALERTVSQELFDRAKDAFGVRGVVDMVFLAGCYETVCSLLNTFAVPAPVDELGGQTAPQVSG